MSNVWATKHRLHLERCEALLDELSESPTTAATSEDQTLRLLLVVFRLLTQHEINKQGQCRACGWPTWPWRFWRRKPQCRVFREMDLAFGQELEVVWWQLFSLKDQDVSLPEVREWLGKKCY